MEFMEATAFTKYLYDYLSEDEYLGLQGHLLQYQNQAKLSLAQVVSEKFVGQCQAEVKVAACE
jgi:hypothetical protein